LSVPKLFDLGAIRFGEPGWLPALALPALLLAVWLWRFVQRQGDRRAFRHRSGASAGVFGDLFSWLALLAAVAAAILALARPAVVASTVQRGGIDLVVLQDGSASMRVPDVSGDRWRRSVAFLRVLGQSVRWERDRLALALFASIATPQIRLTRDPNTFFFFLDNLEAEPPFRVQDAGSWDTNIERGVYWGLRLVEKDQELFGPSPNGRAFVLISDGQAWSGAVERALTVARRRGIPVHVVGVGTTAGGIIPEPERAAHDRPVLSRLDRNSLADIATAGGGRYFELGREPDGEIANAIITTARSRAREGGVSEVLDELYPECLLAAAALLFVAVLTVPQL
jgi:Ca-activated chloride channel family protein